MSTLDTTLQNSQSDPYVSWLRREGIPLFHGGGIAWRLYSDRLLIPASLRPSPVNLPRSDARALLQDSGAYAIRWFSKTYNEPSSFWYVVCDRYDLVKLSRKARNQIRKASRQCVVRRLDPAWVAVNGYDCYAAAFGRYKHGHPLPRADFERDQRSCADGPFTFFGAFVGGRLSGFAKCVVGDHYVALGAFRIDQRYRTSLPSYALLDELLRAYVTESGRTVGNGFLSVRHRTNMQDFLLKFGFRRVYCDLRLAYRPALKAAVSLCYPFRKLIDRMPSLPATLPMKSLLKQEQIRRSYFECP
ncbi:MAG: hypothetical protein ACRD4R_08485 [Candidatus Acidiferrales bacterium]